MLNYERVVFWSSDDECWVVEVPELAGCQADGQTMEEAMRNADIIIKEWIETALMLGREIPKPIGRYAFA